MTDSEVRNYREDFTNPVINSSDSRDLSRRFPEGLIRERISRVTTSLSRFQTPISIVHLRYSRDRLDEAYQNGLLQMAQLTGGPRNSAVLPRRSLMRSCKRPVRSRGSTGTWCNSRLSTPSRQSDRLEWRSAVNYRTRFVLR